VTPKSEQDVANAVADATGPIVIRGGGTRAIGRPLSGAVLSTAALTGIKLYEPGSLTIVANTGTNLAQLETVLAGESQRLPFEPMDHQGLLGTKGCPTVGGIVAANVSGSRRIQAGACRDYLLGVRFVDGQGTIIKNGGRVMKNVTGYDLVKLMAGSYGTLGVLTQVAFKVLPIPEVAATLSITNLSDIDAQRALSLALGSPYEVTGAAHAPQGTNDMPITMIRIEGFENSVKYRAAKLKTILEGIGEVWVESDPEKSSAIWKWARDVELFHEKAGDVWRISVKPTDGPAIGAKLDADGLLYDWGGGLIWALLPEGTDARARLAGFNGHATLIRASNDTRSTLPVFQPEPAPLAAITKGLRNKFDPRGILNANLMG